MKWTFTRRAGESKLDAWYRLFDELLADGPISIGTRADRLAAFLDIVSTIGLAIAIIAGVPVDHVETWRTNCAMTMHAAMVWMGRQLRPYVNAEPIQGGEKSYLELARNGEHWVENDGKNEPRGPCVFYVTPSKILPYEHVGAFGRPKGPRHYETYEGGGGDGTRIGKSDRMLDSLDSYGRRIAGWWEIEDLLADSAPAERAYDAAPPETAPTGETPYDTPTTPQTPDAKRASIPPEVS